MISDLAWSVLVGVIGWIIASILSGDAPGFFVLGSMWLAGFLAVVATVLQVWMPGARAARLGRAAPPAEPLADDPVRGSERATGPAAHRMGRLLGRVLDPASDQAPFARAVPVERAETESTMNSRTNTPRRARSVLGASISLVVVGATMSGCAVLPASQDMGGTSVSPAPAVMYPEIKDAVTASDSRVQSVGVTQSLSGAAEVLTVGVRISGDDPVTTQMLEGILIAIRDSMPTSFDQVDLIIRDTTDKQRVIDISDAVAGLPSMITVLYDGTLTVTRADLDMLAR